MRPISICSGYISRTDLAAWLLALAFAFVFTPAVQADEPVVEVIPLQHRSAVEMLPLLQPFIAKNGIIKAAADKLIIRTSPGNLTELRTLIAQLDRPVRRLLITVKQLSGDTARDSGAALADRIGEDPQAGARVWQTDKRDDADRVQQVQVMEGAQAFIDVGRRIPIADFALEQGRTGTRVEQQTRYIGATTGFYAIPRVNGDTVTIEINPYQTTAESSATPPTFTTQSLHTTVTGKLGEWLEIGASTAHADERDSGALVYSTSQRGEHDRRILLRVTAMP